MAVRTRAVHTLADRDSCSKYSSVFTLHTADDVLANTPHLRYAPLLSSSPIPYCFRTSVLTANNITHRNHHYNNNPFKKEDQIMPKGQGWSDHPAQVFLKVNLQVWPCRPRLA